MVNIGDTGYLFEPGIPKSLMKKMELCLKNIDQTNKMGRNARKTAIEIYSSEKHVVALEDLFFELITKY